VRSGGIKCRLGTSDIGLDSSAAIKHIMELAATAGRDIGLPGGDCVDGIIMDGVAALQYPGGADQQGFGGGERGVVLFL